MFTCRRGGGNILQDREQQATAQSSLSRPGASLWGQVEDSIGLEQSGDQQLHQAAHLSLDPRTWTKYTLSSIERNFCLTGNCKHLLLCFTSNTLNVKNTMLWLIEELMDRGFPSQQEVGKGLPRRTVLQQHGGHQGLSNGLVRHRSAPQERPAVQENSGPAKNRLVNEQ